MASFKRAERLAALPPYLFAKIDKMKQEAIKSGKKIISLGIGDPDLPTPAHVIDKLCEEARNPVNHQYPSYEGMLELRRAFSDWFKKRFNGVELNPETEALTLIGSKEGIGHIPLAFINPGDVALIPDPGYPVYRAGTIFAGGIPHIMPLRIENGFLPDIDAIPGDVAKKARIMFLNYPNNPTGATTKPGFFEKAVEFCMEYNIILCHDAAYSEVCFDGYKSPSMLEVKGAKECSIEFHSLSKTYNMTGWRIGFAAGNAEILSGLGSVKTNLDSGVFQAIQHAGIKALSAEQDCVDEALKTYSSRRKRLEAGLNNLGWEVYQSKATFYVWVKTPKGYTSAEMTEKLISEAGVVVTPGNGFGDYGEGYIRMTLTLGEDKIEEAVDRIKKLFGK